MIDGVFPIFKRSVKWMQYTEMRFASFLSDGFITAIEVNPPERKLAKRISVDWLIHKNLNFLIMESF